MDRICKFLHCVYMGITEAPNDAKRIDRPKEPDNKHTKIISIEAQSLQDGVRSMYVCVILYVCMEDRCVELSSTRYLFSSISHSFLANWSADRSIDDFLNVSICMLYIISGYNVYSESIIWFVCYNLELKLSAINVCLYHITFVW